MIRCKTCNKIVKKHTKIQKFCSKVCSGKWQQLIDLEKKGLIKLEKK